MTFNWKVKIGSLLTAWHRYQVMDLLIPRVSNTGTTMAPQSPITACPFVRWRGSGLLRIIIFVGVLISLKLTTALGRGRHSFSSLRMGSGDWSRFLIQFGFMFSCFLRSRGRGEGNNIYATVGWSLYSAQWWWWTALRTNRPSHSHRSSTQKREILWFWIYWWSGCECDVYLASYSQRVLDVWSDHFRHIVYCGDCFWHSFTMLRHSATHRELYFHFSIFLREWLLVRRSERGNLHYDNVAISGDLLAQSQPVTAHALCMNTAQAGAGAGARVLQQMFLGKKKIDQRFR